MPHSVLIVGMPRSGTSLLAGVFARKGYFLADDPEDELRAGDAHNPGGYWEAQALIDRNAEAYSAVGFPFDNTWLYEAMPRVCAEKLGRLHPLPEHPEFVNKYDQRAPWVWKDPRLCYTLEYWWQMVDRETTRVILVRRDPRAIYQSFVRLGWRERSVESKGDVLRRVADHLSAAEHALERLSIPHEVVEYEQLRADGEQVVQRLTALLELPLSVPDLLFDERLDRSSLRGRVATQLDLAAGRLPVGVRRVVKRLFPTSLMRRLFPERFAGGLGRSGR